jgi:hypothetical protein
MHGTREKRDSILAGLKKVYKHPKWGMERRVVKRCGSHGTREKRDSILAGMKKVYNHPKWGMERRVVKRCGSRGTCKKRDNSMSFPRVTVHAVAWMLSVHAAD